MSILGTPGPDIIDQNYTGDPEGNRVDSGVATRPDGRPNDDLILAGAGDDTVLAGEGDDEVYGEEGDDLIYGKAGDDLLFGGPGDDLLFGGEGNDTLFGGTGSDTLYGEAGDDVLVGGPGPNVIYGGADRDLIIGATPGDFIDGGEAGDDFDTLDLRDSGPLSVVYDSDNPENGTITFFDPEGAAIGTARFVNIENVVMPEELDVTPVANPDVATTDEDTPVIIDVLANDTDPNDDPLTVISATATNGTVEINPDGTLTYTPDADYNGADEIAYTITDPDGNTASSTVAVTIVPVNDAPVANPDFASTPLVTPVVIDVLDNDTDVDGDPLSVTAATAPNGTVEINPDGTLTYTPDAGFFGVDEITYTITDGQGGFDTCTATVTVASGPGLDGIVQGTAGDDIIDINYLGDPQGDRIDNGDAILPGQAPDDDIVFAGEGNDIVIAGEGNDIVFGGPGDDSLFGGAGDDILFGGSGNDLLDGGEGANRLFGGDDRDTFVNIGPGDFVDGGEGGDDFDTLDLRGSVTPGGSLRVSFNVDNPENGTVVFRDADGAVTGTANFINIENVVPCFTPGTAIATARGERLVQELRVGDRIITRDNGIQEIRWIGAKPLSAQEMARSPHLRPVLIKRGSLGDNLPERDMMVSPNHRMLVSNEKTALYFEENEVLAAAKHMTGSQGIAEATASATTYIHFMFDQHEVVLSNGCWSESFQSGDYSLQGLGNAQRAEILELFPELGTQKGLEGYTAARRSLKRHEAMLVAR
jgi:Ca2+-binding RTX toxin-like protein